MNLAPITPAQNEIRTPRGWTIHLPLLIAAGLVVLGYCNYLWFHTLAEMFSIMSGITLYLVARASFVFNRNRFLLFLAQGFFWAACIDVIHTLSYKGMGLEHGDNLSLSTQFWLVARLLEAGTLLLAPLYLDRQRRDDFSFWIMGVVSVGGIVLVFAGWFPETFIDGQGLTPFKVVTEYVIITALAAAAWHLHSRRAQLDAMLYRVLLAIIALTAVSEFFFTIYVDLYGLSNVIGHVLKFWAFWLLLLTVFRWMLSEPFRLLAADAQSFDHMPIPVLLLDAQGVIQAANQRALEERPESTPGRDMHEVWAPSGLTHEDCQVCQAIEAGEALVTETHDGGRDVWYSVHLQPIRRGDVLMGFVCAQINVSERKRAELALEESNRQVRDLYDQAPCGYHSLDPDGVIININQAELDMLGYRRNELVGHKRFVELLTPESRKIVEQNFPAFKERGYVNNLELEVVRKDGSTFIVNLSATAVRDEQGNFLHSRSTFMDVTRRKRAEERLIQSEKTELVGQMAAGLAHDFNNLLGVIMGSLDLLGRDVGNERSQRQIDLAMRASRRAVEVTKSLLAVARRQALTPARLDLKEAMAEVMPLLRQAVGKRIEVRETCCTECAAGLMWVSLDQAGFANAMLNLAVNARDAMADGGNLIIDTQYCRIEANEGGAPANLEPGEYAVISMTDNGTGMPRNVANHAFEPFFSTKPRGHGTGLGLAMVYGFARQSGGMASIYSQAGVGTTVRLYLPASLEGAPTSVGPAGRNPSVMGHGERILLVDDEKDLLDITHEWLLDLGYKVSCATSPQVALETLKDEAFTLLLTDVMMPGGTNGIELANIVLGLRPEMKVLLVSGFSGFPDSGNWPRLAKPFTREELAHKLRTVLDAGAAAPAPPGG